MSLFNKALVKSLREQIIQLETQLKYYQDENRKLVDRLLLKQDLPPLTMPAPLSKEEQLANIEKELNSIGSIFDDTDATEAEKILNEEHTKYDDVASGRN